MNENRFEDRMKELEEILNQLDREDLPLSESIALYEKGTALAKQLQDELKGFEEKIAAITKGEDNE